MHYRYLSLLIILLFAGCTQEQGSDPKKVEINDSLSAEAEPQSDEQKGASNDPLQDQEDAQLTPPSRSQWLNPEPPSGSFRTLEPGLEYGTFLGKYLTNIGDSKVHILRVNPNKFEMALVSAKETGENLKTGPEWATEKELLAVINAGMFRQDYLTNTGYMKLGDFINNPSLNKDNTITAFGALKDSLPEFQIIDLECQDWKQLKTGYRNYSQGIRMMDCNGKNKWGQQPKYWSMVCIGEDKSGNPLLIFTRSPWSVHDFVEIIRNLPLNLQNAMYLEGGPEATFYFKAGEEEVRLMGSYETGFFESDENNRFWKIPNVIGIRRKK